MDNNERSNELKILFEQVIDSGELVKAVFSRKRKASCEYSRVTLRPVSVKNALLYQFEYTYQNKVTHENSDRKQIVDKCLSLVKESFKQINIVSLHEDIQVLANKPEKPRIAPCSSYLPISTPGVLLWRRRSAISLPVWISACRRTRSITTNA